jgi:hypothetical protein
LLQNLPKHRDYRKISPNKTAEWKILQFMDFCCEFYEDCRDPGAVRPLAWAEGDPR